VSITALSVPQTPTSPTQTQTHTNTDTYTDTHTHTHVHTHTDTHIHTHTNTHTHTHTYTNTAVPRHISAFISFFVSCICLVSPAAESTIHRNWTVTGGPYSQVAHRSACILSSAASGQRLCFIHLYMLIPLAIVGTQITLHNS
jgi:hypothetical protein